MTKSLATVRDWMTSGVSTLRRSDSLEVADGVMCLGHIRHLPVVEGGEVVGVLSERDLLRSALGTAMALGIQRPQELMRSVQVGDVMSAPPVTIEPGAPVQRAARAMEEARIGCLPVVEAGRLIGILTQTDVLRYAGQD
jgi:CBS domain-containing protein